ncbi:unnamed protein product [Linum tenue]|nr:unnamed protein product [Linum tenue]
MFSRLCKDWCVQPNIVTYNIVISGLCRHGFVDEAYGLFKMIEVSGCYQNYHSYKFDRPLISSTQRSTRCRGTHSRDSI